MAARKMLSPRERYGAKVRLDIFGDEYGSRTPNWISAKTGVSAATLRSWRSDPGKMPAYRYLQLMDLIESGRQ